MIDGLIWPLCSLWDEMFMAIGWLLASNNSHWFMRQNPRTDLQNEQTGGKKSVSTEQLKESK